MLRSKRIAADGISRLAVFLLTLQVSTAVVATPIEYRFSWTGSATLVKQLPNMSARMDISGDTSNVVVRTVPDFAVTRVPGTGLTGQFSGAGLTGAFSGLDVARESDAIADLLFFRNSSLSGGYQLGMFTAHPSAISSYNLDASFGPVSFAPFISGTASFDFGAAGVLNFSSISSASFEATAGPGTAIDYGFAWTGNATLTTNLVDVHFEMIISGDTADVIVSTVPDFAVNRVLGTGLTGQFSGAGLTGAFSGLVVARESDAIADLLFFRKPSISGYQLGLFAANPSSFSGYNLDTPIELLDFNGFLTGSPSFDFGSGGTLSFSRIGRMSLEVVDLSTPSPVPTPGMPSLVIVGLLAWFMSRRTAAWPSIQARLSSRQPGSS